jgi:hypothetical protein
VKRVFLFPVILMLVVGMACSLQQSVEKSQLSNEPTQTLVVQVESPTGAVQPTDVLAPTLPPEPTLAEATAAEVPTVEEPTATSAPTLEEVTATLPATEAAPPTPTVEKLSPTAAPAGNSGEFFTENFSGSISDFTRWLTVGDPKKHFGAIADGLLKFELPAMDTYAYAARNGYQYADVYVEARGNVLTGTNDSLAVVCRVSDAGWDEFRVSARGVYAGTYEVYRYDKSLVAQHKVPYINLLNGDRTSSLDIKTGSQKNTIGLSCVGQELRLFINGVEQTKHNKQLLDKVLTGGTVGVGVIGYNSTASTVQFDSLLTKKP